MDEKSKSFWRKPLPIPQIFLVWLCLVVVTLLIVEGIALFLNGSFTKPDESGLLVFCIVGATVLLATWLFIRWLCCWRNFKRFLFGVACLVTLLALGYTEEDWRGKHDWEKFKREWEAKGEKSDFKDFVPAPVPDDRNFAMAPIWMESIKATLGTKRARQWKYPDDGRTNFTDRLALNVWRNNDNGNQPTNGNWARGTVTELEPWQTYYRSVTDVENFPLRKAAATNEFPIAPQPQSPAQDVLLALSKYDPAIEELRQASQLPYSRFPIGYDNEDVTAILLPHLGALKKCSQVLQLRTIAYLQNNESQKALADVQLSLRLTDSVRTEPFFISHLVRIAILQITLQPIYEGLEERKWSGAQLADLDSDLAKLDLIADCQNVQKSEIFTSTEIANYLRRHRDYISQFAQMGVNFPTDARFRFTIFRYMPGGWFYQSALKNGRTAMKYLPAVNLDTRTISPALVRKADASANNGVSFFDPLDGLKEIFNMDDMLMGSFLKRFAYAQASVGLARTAIALERYRLQHGEFPGSLDALAPQFIAQVPHDVIGGQPLNYRRTKDGQFVLYSVGWNERDDGGVVVLKKGETPLLDISQGDWVWRYPAKVE